MNVITWTPSLYIRGLGPVALTDSEVREVCAVEAGVARPQSDVVRAFYEQRAEDMVRYKPVIDALAGLYARRKAKAD
jgi:hypothetical protein